MRQKKKSSEKKKIPRRESNLRPLNLQPPHIASYRLRDVCTKLANLNGHELRVASLAALAPPITQTIVNMTKTIGLWLMLL